MLFLVNEWNALGILAVDKILGRPVVAVTLLVFSFTKNSLSLLCIIFVCTSGVR